ncbi:MAG: ABC transporter permease subunit [Pseudomonadota bacterium]|nr:ABC transporter permease subunit [Pseudomonadota bacterium]
MVQYEYDRRSGKDVRFSRYPNHWDMLAFGLLAALLFSLAKGVSGLATPDGILQDQAISLSYQSLPLYALYSVVRMFLALVVSCVVALTLGTMAARSSWAETVIIPVVDVLQSVPILGYLRLAASFVIYIFPHRGLGFELVALFAIFTSQVWNMLLSVYQSFKMLPESMHEASAMMHLKRLQKFWRVDIPYAMPDLLMNMMISLSAGWFYVVESEAIPLHGIQNNTYLLPGIGSYMWLAQQAQDTYAMIAALTAMFCVIIIYDQLIFRPLSHLLRAYQSTDEDIDQRSWVVNLVMRTQWFRYGLSAISRSTASILLKASKYSSRYVYQRTPDMHRENENSLAKSLLSIACLGALIVAVYTLVQLVDARTVLWIVFCGACTALRVFVVLALAIMIWLPVGVWIGLRPRVADWIEPVIQILASFPPNLLYPMIYLVVLKYQLSFNIWCAPLMILGTQWYILVNVIAGVRNIPRSLIDTAKNFHFGRRLFWQKLMLPSIAPYLVVGSIAAAGGAWNASIAAEVLSWGQSPVYAVGLGAFIDQSSGQVPLEVVGVAVMCAYVVLINRFFWYPLFHYVEKHYAT